MLINELLAVLKMTAAMIKGAINKSCETRGMDSYADNRADANPLIDPEPVEIKR